MSTSSKRNETRYQLPCIKQHQQYAPKHEVQLYLQILLHGQSEAHKESKNKKTVNLHADEWIQLLLKEIRCIKTSIWELMLTKRTGMLVLFAKRSKADVHSLTWHNKKTSQCQHLQIHKITICCCKKIVHSVLSIMQLWYSSPQWIVHDICIKAALLQGKPRKQII